MKGTIGLLTFAAALALCTVGCDREDPAGVDGGNGLIEARISAGVATKATGADAGTDAGTNGLATKDGGTAAKTGTATRADGNLWAADNIGVMVTVATTSAMASEFVNVEYATTATGATTADFEATGDAIYFRDPDETVTFAAYAPYTASANIATLPGTGGVISASTSSQGTASTQTAVDFLYASGATGSQSYPDVKLEFSHVMSKIVINLTGTGLDSDALAAGTFTLGGLIHDGAFDVNPSNTSTVGTAYLTGSTADNSWSLSSNALAGTGSGCDLSYTAIVFPQTPSALDLSAKVDGLPFAGLDLLSVVADGELKAGKSYTFSVAVSPTGLEATGCTVSDWNASTYSDLTFGLSYDPKDMVLTYTITDPNTEITLPLYSTVNCTVDWGDGTDIQTVTSTLPTHTYTAAGEYDVVIEGTVTQLNSDGIASSAAPNTTLTAVKQWGKTGLTSMAYAFTYCTSLSSIPDDTVGSFANVTSFLEAFSCSSLTSIPSGLFAYAGDATSFYMVFDSCRSVTSIPENLLSNCTAAKNFTEAFAFLALTEIPENLFANCLSATNFFNVFYGCTSLTSIPGELFANNTEATTFESAFNGCTSLTEIPENLFANNTKVTDFLRTFSGCTGLTSESAYDVRVIDEVETKIHLYERADHTDIYTAPTSYTGCYYRCSHLTDYSSIPSGWK